MRSASPPYSHHRDVGRVDGFHSDHVITAIDMVDLAGDPGREIAQKIEAGAADILDRHVALQWRIVLVPFKNIAEIADARSRECSDWPRRNRVDANILSTEVDREIAHARFERCL